MGVDYGILANDSYISLVKNAPRIGADIAKALDEMVKSGFDSEKLHVVGHSMGGQIAGNIGRKVSFKIPRITGKIFINKNSLSIDFALILFKLIHVQTIT
jgi:hypothetical protein